MSSTYNKKSNGPRMEPCGTPHVIGNNCETELFTTTH